jgi:U3 small nucleolar RNA-associated protein 11
VGFLERKKDYTVRAQDYHRKQDRITALREKAAFRNPDEFYFGMKNAQIKDGKHKKTEQAERRQWEEQVGVETVRIMKDQDLSYVRMQKQKDAKKVEKLRSSLHLIEAAAADPSKTNSCTTTTTRKHTVFVEDRHAAQNFDVVKHFGTVPELAGRAHNRLRLETLQQIASENAGYVDQDEEGKSEALVPRTKEEMKVRAKEARRVAKKVAKAKEGSYREMRAREKRVGAMERAEAHLVTEKLVASKGRKRKIAEAENGRPAQYRWRRKRLG